MAEPISYVPTKWGIEYILEYPDISPVYQSKDDDNYEKRCWGTIVWSFLESGREIVKITPPEDIDPVHASISLASYLRKHPDLPIDYTCKKKNGGPIYLFRKF